MSVELLQIWMLLQNVRKQLVDVAAHIMNLLVHIFNFSFSILLVDGLARTLSGANALATENVGSFRICLHFKVDGLTLLIELGLDSLFYDHVADDGLSFLCLNIQELTQLLE